MDLHGALTRLHHIFEEHVPESQFSVFGNTALQCKLSIYHIFGDYRNVIFNSDPGIDITPPITLILPQK